MSWKLYYIKFQHLRNGPWSPHHKCGEKHIKGPYILSNGPVTRAYISTHNSTYGHTSRSLYTSFVYASNTLTYALTRSKYAKPQEEF